VPVLNKIDLPAADPDRVKAQIEDVIGSTPPRPSRSRPRSGLGIPDVLEAIVNCLPAPRATATRP
jgi:GTP-binding protein LepA